MTNASFLTILMYVFENYIDPENPLDETSDIVHNMINKGFNKERTHHAMNWFKSLAFHQNFDQSFISLPSENAVRVYSSVELARITDKAREFLSDIEAMNIIDSQLRELILHHALILDEAKIDVAEIKWVTLVSLFGLPDKKNKLALLEDIIFYENADRIH